MTHRVKIKNQNSGISCRKILNFGFVELFDLIRCSPVDLPADQNQFGGFEKNGHHQNP